MTSGIRSYLFRSAGFWSDGGADDRSTDHGEALWQGLAIAIPAYTARDAVARTLPRLHLSHRHGLAGPAAADERCHRGKRRQCLRRQRCDRRECVSISERLRSVECLCDISSTYRKQICATRYRLTAGRRRWMERRLSGSRSAQSGCRLSGTELVRTDGDEGGSGEDVGAAAL